MKRLELIEQLEKVQWNIEQVDKQVNRRLDENTWYCIFGTTAKWEHEIEIRTKALAYWKRRFNRIINELKY